MCRLNEHFFFMWLISVFFGPRTTDHFCHSNIKYEYLSEHFMGRTSVEPMQTDRRRRTNQKKNHFTRRLTGDIEADRVLDILHAAHDLTAVQTRVACPEVGHNQGGVPHWQRVTGHRQAAPVPVPHLYHSTMGHQHHSLLVFSFQLGPLDPQLVLGVCCGRRGGHGAGGGQLDDGKVTW